MRWDKLEQQRRMQHEDDTLHQGPVEWGWSDFKDLVKFKPKPKLAKRTFEDRRGMSGAEVLMAKLATNGQPKPKGKRTGASKSAPTSEGVEVPRVGGERQLDAQSRLASREFVAQIRRKSPNLSPETMPETASTRCSERHGEWFDDVLFGADGCFSVLTLINLSRIQQVASWLPGAFACWWLLRGWLPCRLQVPLPE